MIDPFEMDSRVPLSLDTETSGVISTKHSILSLSCYNENICLHYDIRHNEQIEYTQEALDINKISLKDLASPRRIFLKDAIKDMESKLNEDNYLLLGFNVGSFDMAFLLESLEDSILKEKFGYRCFDLNTAILLVSKTQKVQFQELKAYLKSEAKSYMRIHAPKIYIKGEHNSLYDVYMCYRIYKMLT